MSKSAQDVKRDCRAEALEALAALYLRLNGYFCITNYLYHRSKQDTSEGLRTESDLLALRMPHQCETLEDGVNQTNDTELVLKGNDKIDCVIAEVKESAVEFNPPIRDAHGWKVILDAIRMFGVLPAGDFDDHKSGIAIAKGLHGQIIKPAWAQIPVAGDEKQRIWVRMLVFARSSAQHAKNRKFISLEHCLDFICGRMRPGAGCNPYPRGAGFSPWRGIARKIVEFLDQPCKEPTLDSLLAYLCARDSLAPFDQCAKAVRQGWVEPG